MINSELKIKLIDFGFSIQSSSDQLDLFCGTPNYMSPEIVLKKEYSGAPNDIWGFGVLAFKILTGHFPFASESTDELNRKITELDFICPQFMGKDVKRIFVSIFKISAQSRPSAKELLQYEFFN